MRRLAAAALAAAFLVALPAAAAAPSANRPPAFPAKLKFTAKTKFTYDDGGLLYGGLTTIVLRTPAVDPDRDKLAYSWKASNGKIRGKGLTARWDRALDYGEIAAGVVTITARDRKGGTATAQIIIGI